MNVQEKLADQGLFDVAVMRHGFTDYMRDYDIIVEAGGIGAGTYRYRFTHVPYTELLTLVSDGTWQMSWDDSYTDYQRWLNAGEPDGFVWGTRWSMAYPGLIYKHDSLFASAWTKRFNKPMHEVVLETEAFSLRLVFHDVEIEKLSNAVTVIDKAIIPLQD